VGEQVVRNRGLKMRDDLLVSRRSTENQRNKFPDDFLPLAHTFRP